jgi:hypothetical protein
MASQTFMTASTDTVFLERAAYQGRIWKLQRNLRRDLNLVSLRFLRLDLPQPAFPMNGLSGFGYVKVLRQNGLAADGAVERQRWVRSHNKRILTLGSACSCQDPVSASTEFAVLPKTIASLSISMAVMG